MKAPRATRAQLLPIVERAIATRTPARPVVVIVQADPAEVPELGDVHGTPVVVRGARSPLAVRSLLHEADGSALVVLTDCDASELGDDVLARTSRRRLVHLDRWATVCQLFGAERPTADLARRPHLADALIEARPLDGYPPLASRVLDLDSALATLLRVSIGVPDEIDDLPGLMRWAIRAENAGRLANAQSDLLADLIPALHARFSAGADAVIAVVRVGRSDELVPFGIAAGTVHALPADDVAAIARLDEWLGRPGLAGDAYRGWGAASVEVVRRVEDPALAAGWVERAGVLLQELGAQALAERSDVLTAGFDQRIRRAAEALSRWRSEPDDADLAEAADRAIGHVASHDTAIRFPERVERLRMAARLVRRGDFRLVGLTDLTAAALAYIEDGAWLDAARTAVSRGDGEPSVGALMADITAEADAARVVDGLRFAQIGIEAGSNVVSPLIGVEAVLDEVVAPLAEDRRVLVVVLDGLGWTTFTEFVGALEGGGWVPWQRDNVASVAVAALPTVTERSRTSLLAGTLRTGDDGSERRAFAAHPRLVQASGAGAPPVLFHKRDLRRGGLDTLPAELLERVADDRQRVVGVVLNNIDERLKDVAQPTDRWDLRDLDPLSGVLDEARRNGRVVVLTADHGHVLDRDAELRQGGGGGERWRPADTPPGDGEILVQGPRVVTDDHQAVLPWKEQLRYGVRRNGYHGGLTPKELFVPLVVLSIDDLSVERGWRPGTFHRPTWWHHRPLRVASPAINPPVFEAAVSEVPTLFDEPLAPAAVSSPEWLDALLSSGRYAERRTNPRVRIDDADVRRLLTVLDDAGTMAVPTARLADAAGLPVARIDRYVAQLQDLLNVDGYGVVTAAGNEVRFDRPLLVRQFEL